MFRAKHCGVIGMLDSEDEDTTILRSTGNDTPINTVTHPRRLKFPVDTTFAAS